jgi:hypothetical protein
MAILSNNNGKFAVDSTGAIQLSGSAGTANYVLVSGGAAAAPTWVAASTVIGGPYVPIAGDVTINGYITLAAGKILTVGGNLFVTGTSTLTGVLSGSTGTFSGSGTILSLNRNAPGTSLIELKTANTIRGKLGATTTKSLVVYSDVTENAHVENNGNIGLYGSAINFLIGDFAEINFRESGAITIDSDNNQSSRNFQFKDGDGSSLMFIGDTGNVMIGGTTTFNGVTGETGFEIYGNTAQLLINNPSYNHFTIYSASDSNIYNIFGSSGNYLIGTGNKNTTSWSEKMRIDSSGRTIIQSGTFTTPAYTPAQGYPLHVQGIASQCLISIGRSGQTTGSQGTIIGLDTTTSYLWNRDNINITFGTNDTTRMTIQSGGNVGIATGTFVPTQKLDVDGQMTHDGLVMKSGDGVYIDRYLAYTINISLIAFNWVDTGIYSNSGSYQLGASGTYAVQIYSDSHSGEPYWYSAWWSGIMSWHQGSVNQNSTFEIPLTTAAHSTNGRTLELRIQNTLISGPGTPVNNARLEVRTTAAGTNSVSLFFRFRRLI